MPSAARGWLVTAAALLAGLAWVLFEFPDGGPDSVEQRIYSYEELTGSVFLPAPSAPFQAPAVRELPLPPTPEATSIWAATGRDFRGRIWVGVTAGSGRSAHLIEYDPRADAWRDHGGVVDHLKAAGVYRAGALQSTIHSRIVPAADGWLYFASADGSERGDDGTRLPPWGGHLWRIHPERHAWEHLLAVPEGLIAVSGVGRYIYALGYWGHVLFQWDTETRAARRVAVGSVGGHVSRNFLADARGHAYVPRLRREADGSVSAALIEYDSSLKELAATRLDFYLEKGRPEANHGIVGLAYLPGGGMLFTTHLGQLYRIEPGRAGAAAVTALGWMHPDGSAYAPSLFALGGSSLIAGVTQHSRRHDWVVFDLRTGTSAAFPLDTLGLKGVAVYGSMSRDDAGRLYVGGWAARDAQRQRPVVLQIDPGR